MEEYTNVTLYSVAGHPIIFEIDGKSLFSDYPIILDFGGCIGRFSIDLRKHLNKNGTYHIFEPNPYLYNFLYSILKDYENFNIYRKAIWYKNQINSFYIGRTNKSSSLESSHKNLSREMCNVETISLDNVLSNFKEIDLIKMDIEGTELDTILNASKEQLNKINQMIIEFHLDKGIDGYTEEKMDKVCKYLEESGLINIHKENFDILFINDRLLKKELYEKN